MSISDQPNDIRRPAKRSVPAAPPPIGRGADKRVTRWIGAGHRKAGLPSAEAADPVVRTMPGQVIKLSWADTFGRPARPDFGPLFRSDPATAQVLPFRSREARQAAPPQDGDQPFVPVLR
ncbi:hypothetical protein MKK88_23725 [Methylobacterium sp. E-005]|uniref:hypothetical protein n=1 Tax=Methylobacterium sp. E-005 TaxID=2836549 RepID=UPI001FBA26BB|nr:hypothetical protein [Methylobacterium sp. E-005]MCJ2088968.1 hypothetical protein [Methylobacterium sp. E-005]